MKEIKYKGSPREYTVFGISPVFKEIVDKNFIDFFGGKTLSHLYFVVRNGTFYHFQIDEEVEMLIKAFLERVRDGKINLNAIYKEYDANLSKIEKIYKKNPETYGFETLKEFYALYPKFIKISYSSFYSADFVNKVITKKSDAEKFLNWIIKIRKRGENVFKYGENVFIPNYSAWLAKNIPGNYSAEEIRYLTYSEILEYIDNSKYLPPKETLEDRKKIFFASYRKVGKETYLSGKEAEREISKLKLFKDIDASVEQVSEFFGQVAYKGKVAGKAVLIFKREDMNKFKDGEIIVSPMTEPGYIPIMKKARAIVTDEGGMLCHAAIVAREMKKPCIIGTKIATKVLKDGDLVEIDANKGIVKILN